MTAKLLSPLNIGALDLCHRAVFPGAVMGGRHALPDPFRPTRYAHQASRGGLIISEPLAVDLDGRRRATGNDLRHGTRWPFAVGAVHDAGGFILAQLAPAATCDAPADQTGAPRHAAVIAGYRRTAQDAREAGFDGIEINAAGGGLLDRLSQGDCIAVLLDVLDAVIADWAADRVGLRLSPHRAPRCGSDVPPLELSEGVLGAVNEREVAYVHFAGEGACPGVGLYGLTGARRLRAAVAWPLLVSGPFSPLAALAAVGTRWADAVGFETAEDARDLLAALRVADGTG